MKREAKVEGESNQESEEGKRRDVPILKYCQLLPIKGIDGLGPGMSAKERMARTAVAGAFMTTSDDGAQVTSGFSLRSFQLFSPFHPEDESTDNNGVEYPLIWGELRGSFCRLLSPSPSQLLSLSADFQAPVSGSQAEKERTFTFFLTDAAARAVDGRREGARRRAAGLLIRSSPSLGERYSPQPT